jgi:hypothetical protein
MAHKEISKEEVQKFLHYDPETGYFTWLASKRGVKKGSRAGCLNVHGYTFIGLNYTDYLAHRLAWVYVNGEIPDGLFIDHINGKRNDNRIENLRLATPMQNGNNRGIKHTPSKLQLFLSIREST